MFKRTLTLLAASLVLPFAGIAHATELVTANSVNVQSVPGMVAAIDKWFQSDDARGDVVSLFEAEFSGEGGGSHVLLAYFDDYAAYEASAKRRAGSVAWQALIAAVEPIAAFQSSTMLIKLDEFGENTDVDNYHAVFALQVQDAAKYRKAFNKFAKAEVNAQAPGTTTLFAVRAGGGGAFTHLVVMTAPGFAAMHRYLDAFLASDDYADFKKEVSGIRKVLGISTYRRLGRWGR